VSIVVVNHNYRQYLAQSTGSALAQSYPAVEVVVVDDGSADGSRDVIAGFGARVVPVLKENGGQASAMNAGFAATRGEVVVFLDADDWLYPDAAGRFAAALADSRSAKAQGILDVVDATGRPSGESIPAVPSDAGDLAPRTLRVGPMSYVCPPSSGNAWSRRFLERVMPLPEVPRRGAADNLLTDTAPLHGLVQNVGAPVGAYRRHGASMSSARRRLTAKTADGILANHERRSRFLAEAARDLGLDVDARAWGAENWRIVLLRHLTAAPEAPPITDLLRACRRQGRHGPKAAGIAAFAAAAWMLPRPLGLRLAGAVVHPEFLQ
jgi:glycosyltransferase involved in cell wall biosynthesis